MNTVICFIFSRFQFCGVNTVEIKNDDKINIDRKQKTLMIFSVLVSVLKILKWGSRFSLGSLKYEIEVWLWFRLLPILTNSIFFKSLKTVITYLHFIFITIKYCQCSQQCYSNIFYFYIWNLWVVEHNNNLKYLNKYVLKIYVYTKSILHILYSL